MLIGLVAGGEEGEGEEESHSKVGTLLGPTKNWEAIVQKRLYLGLDWVEIKIC